jgi:protein O-GlcNAc transferase
VRDRLASYGLPPDRLDIFGKTSGSRQYLERFSQIDIALDTFPFNGITTTCEGLWMGVPCVSLSGETSVSRAGRSILHAANLLELASNTPEQFVNAAAELASDMPRLRELRLSMRDRLLASPVMDHRRFARDLEAAFRQMWRAWCEGHKP